jgi:hypothetical protein
LQHTHFIQSPCFQNFDFLQRPHWKFSANLSLLPSLTNTAPIKQLPQSPHKRNCNKCFTKCKQVLYLRKFF